MALATFDALRDLVATPHQRIYTRKAALTMSREEHLASTWQTNTFPLGTPPTTAAVPTNTTAGALANINGGSGRLILVGGSFMPHNASLVPSDFCPFMLVDRLSHQGGLAANINTLQTTNLPTAALTRYTSGVGVMAALEVYSSLGTGACTFTTIYTNQAGTGSRTSTMPTLSTSMPRTNSLVVIPLQTGDTGVKSVESVQLSAGKASAGNFGVTLFKPLAMVIPNNHGRFGVNEIVGWNEEIVDGACLQLMPLSPEWSNAVAPEYFVTLDFAEC